MENQGIGSLPVEESVETPVTDNLEQGVVEVQEQEAPVAKSAYSPEEISKIIAEDGEVDVTRLSPEGQAVMKAMQRGFTPKLQEAAEIRKELDRIRSEFEAAKPKPQPKDIYEAYDQDPEGVVNYVNQAIRDLAQEASPENIAKIEELRDLKDQFRQRAVTNLQSQQTKQREYVEVMKAITDAVPDISSKQVALRDFALEVLGMSPEELATETDPMRSGMNAARTVARINRAYDAFNAGKTAKTKVVKPQPTKVEAPGNGYEQKPETLLDKKREAIKSGNFRNFFLELGDN